MEVASEFGELCASTLLLPLELVLSRVLVVAIKVPTDFFVLSLNVVKILLPRVEVVLVLSTVEASVAEQRKIRDLNLSEERVKTYYFWTIFACSLWKVSCLCLQMPAVL